MNLFNNQYRRFFLVTMIAMIVSCDINVKQERDTSKEADIKIPDLVVVPVESLVDESFIDKNIEPEAVKCDDVVRLLRHPNCGSEDLCGNELNCICVGAGETLSWVSLGLREFKIKWKSPSPFEDPSCARSFNNEHTCVIRSDLQPKSSYSYVPILKQCPDGKDPRVVIRPPTFDHQ